MLKNTLEKLELQPEDTTKTAILKGLAEGALEGAAFLGLVGILSGILSGIANYIKK